MTWTGTAAQRTLIALLGSIGFEVGDHEVAIECRASAKELEGRVQIAVEKGIDPRALAEQIRMKQFRKYDYLLTEELLCEAAATDRLNADEALTVIRQWMGPNRLA